MGSPADACPSDEEDGNSETHETFGQSFQIDWSTLGCRVVYLDSTVIASMATFIAVYVDKTTGALKCETGGTNAGMHFFFWIEATGQFDTGGDPAL
jgi:hypothetical protein